MKKIKKIIAILAMVILLFCNGCIQDIPLGRETFTNIEDFIVAMKTRYNYEKTNDYYAFGESFTVGGNEYKAEITLDFWKEGKKYNSHSFVYQFIDEAKGIYKIISVRQLSIYEQPYFTESDIVSEIETDKGEALLIYNTLIKRYKFLYRDSVSIVINDSRMHDEEEFVELSMKIIESRYIIEELK